MEPPKAVSEKSAELAPDQTSETLSKEEILQLLRNSQKVSDNLLSSWLSQMEKQIKEVRQHDVLVMVSEADHRKRSKFRSSNVDRTSRMLQSCLSGCMKLSLAGHWRR